jgi:hypothetical protein
MMCHLQHLLLCCTLLLQDWEQRLLRTARPWAVSKHLHMCITRPLLQKLSASPRSTHRHGDVILEVCLELVVCCLVARPNGHCLPAAVVATGVALVQLEAVVLIPGQSSGR